MMKVSERETAIVPSPACFYVFFGGQDLSPSTLVLTCKQSLRNYEGCSYTTVVPIRGVIQMCAGDRIDRMDFSIRVSRG
jgi:hypothetical protein